MEIAHVKVLGSHWEENCVDDTMGGLTCRVTLASPCLWASVGALTLKGPIALGVLPCPLLPPYCPSNLDLDCVRLSLPRL